MLKRVSLAGIIILLVWISFFAEPVQLQYSKIVKWGLAALLIISIIAHKPNYRKLFFEKQDLLLWLYLLVIICGIFFAENFQIALEWFYRFILPIPTLYFLIKNVFTKVNRQILVKVICFLSCIITLIGFMEFIFRKNLIYEYLINNPYYYRFLYLQPRIMSTLLHPAVLGSYLVACLPFSFFLATTSKIRFIRYLGLCSALLCIAGVILTFSRGSIVGIIFLCGVYFWRKKRQLFLRSLAASLAILLITCSFFPKDSIFQRFGWQGLTRKRTYVYKIERAFITYRMLLDKPIFGVGLNHYRFLFNRYWQYSYKVPSEWKIADNMYLTILAETGIAGFCAFIAFIVFLFRKAFLYLRLTKEQETKELVTALIAGIIGLMINMHTYDLLYWTTPLFLFWIFTGMVVAVVKIEKLKLK